LMWAWDLLLKYVLPVALSTLSIALWLASRFCPPLRLILGKLPIIVMIGWVTFALYYLWLFGSYQCFDDRLFILFWAMSFPNVVQASNGNRTEITHNTKADYHAPVTNMTIHIAPGAQLPSNLFPWTQLKVPSSMKQVCNSQDSEDSISPTRNLSGPAAPATRDNSPQACRFSDHEAHARTASRVEKQQAKKDSVKREGVDPAARDTAGTSATPVVVSQHPPAGEPSMTPRNVFNTVCDFIQRVCVKSEQYVKPEQTLKRPRNANEHTEDQLPNKKQKLTVSQLKEKLDKAGVPYLKNARKADLLESAEKADLL
jgi:hypothetical protein